MNDQLNDFLRKMHRTPSHVSTSAYDTAWAAWHLPPAMDWLLEAQHPDGSWGAELEYHHDRVISTLAAINAIAARSTNAPALQKAERGVAYLEKAISRLGEDVYETVGFELLLPGLVGLARKQGLKVQRIEELMAPQLKLSREKLALVPQKAIYSPHFPVAFSLEFLSFEQLDRSAVHELRASNGSIHNSPAATAYVDAVLGGAQGRGYLETLMTRYGGAMPAFAPLDIFEPAWALYHLSLGTQLTDLPAARPFVDQLARLWNPRGLSFSSNLSFADLDDTALTFRLLHLFGVEADPAGLEFFETPEHFRCYPLERNISIDVHIHILHALREARDFPRRAEMLSKALNVLKLKLSTDFITDKWHVSPYYSTSHAIAALTGLEDELIQRQLSWLLKTQREDGSWSWYPSLPKAAIEETAYAVMALATVYEKKGGIPFEPIERGIAYLEKHYTASEELPRLWITKILYNPYHIVESALLAVFAQYQRIKP